MIGRRTVSAAALVAAVFLTGCSDEHSTKTGADRDAHGCIGSAGYKWCAKTNRCERPWELATKERFEKSEEAFKSFCEGK